MIHECPNCQAGFDLEDALALGYRTEPNTNIRSISWQDLWLQCPACLYKFTLAEEEGFEGPLGHTERVPL